MLNYFSHNCAARKTENANNTRSGSVENLDSTSAWQTCR